jgi:DNA processing protein
MSSRLEAATFLLALGRLRGVGARTVANVVAIYPELEALLAANPDELKRALGARASAALGEGLSRDWPLARSWAERVVEEHLARSISVIPITDASYPPLLRFISDPPPVLFVRGDERALSSTKVVAVVGTRAATDLGLTVARRVARRFAEAGFVVASGLAKGIDTAAHEGALLGGKTIAVLGTPLDKVYPAENKHLASQVEAAGALVSEYPMGTISRGQSFVERDRIQAGMSLAVVPVQTGLAGGTQHTIRFAEQQGRLLLCPRPMDVEASSPAYDGIHQLIESGRARSFDSEAYPDLWVLLQEHEARLTAGSPPSEVTAAPQSPGSRRRLPGGKKGRAAARLDEMRLFGDPSALTDEAGTGVTAAAPSIDATPPPRPVELLVLLSALEQVLDEMAPNLDGPGLEIVLRQLRGRRDVGAE